MTTKKKPATRAQKIVTLMTIIGAIISISYILFNEQIIINFELNKISDIDFENNYFALDAVLINNYRDSIVFPDDKLTVSAVLLNKWDREMNYFPTIKVLQGEKMIQGPFQLKNYTLIPNEGWTFFQQTFFVGDENTKRLQITIEGFDVETGDQIIKNDIEVELSILSLSNKIQSEQVNTLLMGVIASSVIGGGTLTALYFNQRNSHKEIKKLDKQNELSEKQIKLLQKQNQDLKEQTSIQNRPWVSIADIEPRYSLKPNMLEINIKNFGKSPAHNIVSSFMVSDEEINEENWNPITVSSDSYSLAPNEIIAMRRVLTPDEYKMAHGSRRSLYFALELNYTYENEKTGKFVLFGDVNEGARFAMTQSKKILE